MGHGANANWSTTQRQTSKARQKESHWGAHGRPSRNYPRGRVRRGRRGRPSPFGRGRKRYPSTRCEQLLRKPKSVWTRGSGSEPTTTHKEDLAGFSHRRCCANRLDALRHPASTSFIRMHNRSRTTATATQVTLKVVARRSGTNEANTKTRWNARRSY